MISRSNHQLRRRDFLALSSAAAASVILPGEAGAAAATAEEWRNKQSGMTYRRLGRTGAMVSSVGMGGDDIRPDNNDFVLWAVDHGLNYFDTAPNYGNGASERGFADVLKARGRDKIFQNTKVNLFPNRTMVFQRFFSSLPEAEQTQIRDQVAEEIAKRGLENPDYLGPYFTGQASGLRAAMIANLLQEKYPDKIDRQKEYQAVHYGFGGGQPEVAGHRPRGLPAHAGHRDAVRNQEYPGGVRSVRGPEEAGQGPVPRFLGAHRPGGRAGCGHRHGRLFHGDGRLPLHQPQVGRARSWRRRRRRISESWP